MWIIKNESVNGFNIITLNSGIEQFLYDLKKENLMNLKEFNIKYLLNIIIR